MKPPTKRETKKSENNKKLKNTLIDYNGVIKRMLTTPREDKLEEKKWKLFLTLLP